MRPVLCHFFGLPIFSYGFFMALGFLFATLAAIEMGKKYEIKKEDLLDLGVWILISGVLGARIFYVGIHLEYYLKHPLEILLINKGGLVYYGGLIGSTLAALVFIQKKKTNLWILGDILMAVLPVGQMFGRIGCFMNGCCFGIPSTSFIRVTFPMNSFAFEHYQEFTPVHPVQLYEAFGAGVLFLLLSHFMEKKKFHGQIMALYCVFYGILRFVVEFYRADSMKLNEALTISQGISIAIIAIGFILYLFRRKNRIDSQKKIF